MLHFLMLPFCPSPEYPKIDISGRRQYIPSALFMKPEGSHAMEMRLSDNYHRVKMGDGTCGCY